MTASPSALLDDDRARGVFRVARRAFTDPVILARERAAIFDQCWLYLGHATELPNPGDFVARTVAGRAWKGRYRGQRQKWFAARFTGKDSEINVENPGGGHKAEFVKWRWEPMKNLPQLIIPFKRPVYERVVKEFSKLAG